MKYKLLLLFLPLIFQEVKVNGQSSCILDEINLVTTGYWPFTWNNDPLGTGPDNNDIAWKIIPIDDEDAGSAKDNGFIVVGETETETANKIDAVVMRIDPDNDPDPIWVKYFGDSKNDAAYSVVQNSSNNHIIVCGTIGSNTFGSPKNFNVWLVELDLDGNEIGADSEYEYGSSGNDAGYSIIEDGDYFVIAGGTGDENHIDGDLEEDLPLNVSDINAGGDYWVIKINKSDFTIEWERNYHGDNPGGTTDFSDFARSIIKTHGDDYIVTGFCESCENNMEQQQAMQVRISPSESQVFKLDYGDETNDYERDQGCHSIIEGLEGSTYRYIGTGVHHPSSCFGAATHEVLGLKTATGGTNVWTVATCSLDQGKFFGGDRPDDAYDILQTCDDEYLIVGTTASKGGDVGCNNGCSTCYTRDAWIIKLNTSGGIVWEEPLGGAYNDEAHSVIELEDGHFVIAGEFGTRLSQGQDFYVVKFHLDDCPLKTEQVISDKSTDLITAYPNPSDGSSKVSLTVSINITAAIYVQVIDQIGKVLTSSELNVDGGIVKEFLPVNNLPEGLYFIKAIINGEVYQTKLSVQ